MKSLLSLFALALVVPVAHAQDAKPLSASLVPLRADAPLLFAPRGWKIEKRVNGDLNRDKVADAALVLVENKPVKDEQDIPTARSRALVVLLREGKGWRRAGFNNSLLLGTRDGGALYGAVETPVHVSIVRGILLVEQESGSREVETTTYSFRFNRHLTPTPDLKVVLSTRVFLIGFDSNTRDRLSGDSLIQSANFLLGRRTTTIWKGGQHRSQTKVTRASRMLRPLESIRVDERYAD